jgi:DNA (cytosine-5)-methyltransferase 1
MTKFKEWNNDRTIELLVGGTPCQSYSVAGLRKGISDPRGSLMLTYLAMAEQFKPKWIVWENVPGVLSSNGGRDFGTFLGALGKIGYGFSYRMLDAQFFGVPQRRRRVFVVGYLGDWRRAASVLFEPESMSGNPPPSREAGQRVAPTVTVGPPFSRTGNSRVETEALVTYALPGNWIGRKPENGGNQVEPFVDLSPCQTATDVHAVVASRMRGFGDYTDDGTASTVKARDDKDATDLVAASTVRRLTPKECERLQGFPDDFSRIPWRNKEPEDCPNGHRYKALGNSMAVPVMNWIGRRIDMVEKGEL